MVLANRSPVSVGRIGTRLVERSRNRVDVLSLSPTYWTRQKPRMFVFPRFQTLDSFSYVEPHKSMYIRMSHARKVPISYEAYTTPVSYRGT